MFSLNIELVNLPDTQEFSELEFEPCTLIQTFRKLDIRLVAYTIRLGLDLELVIGLVNIYLIF